MKTDLAMIPVFVNRLAAFCKTGEELENRMEEEGALDVVEFAAERDPRCKKCGLCNGRILTEKTGEDKP